MNDTCAMITRFQYLIVTCFLFAFLNFKLSPQIFKMWPWRNRHVMLKVIVGAALTFGVVNLVLVNKILINEYVNKPQTVTEQVIASILNAT